MQMLTALYFGVVDELEAERTCKIPKIYPFEDYALNLISEQIRRKRLQPPPCFNNPPWFKTDLGSKLIRLDETAAHWWEVDCCYFPFVTMENYKTL